LKPSIYLKGIDKFERATNRLLKDVTDEKTKLLLEQAKVVRDAIREAAPPGPTGNLKAACYAKAYPETISRPAIAFAGIRPRKAPHAHLVEYGHGGPHPAPPHPFFFRAWESVRDEVRETIKQGLKAIVERV